MILECYKSFWARAFDFSGRSSRPQFWYPVLVNAILGAIIYQISRPIYFLFSVASVIPGLSNSIRRLRDVDKAWQWIFIALVPFLGALILLYFFIQPTAVIA